MGQNPDWLPQNHVKVMLKAQLTVEYLNITANQIRMGIVGTNFDFYNEFLEKYNAFSIAFNDWLNPAERTPTRVITMLETEKEFKKLYRALYVGYLKYNQNVNNKDLESMGLPQRTSGRTPSPVPTTYPEFEIDTSVIRRIILHYRDEGKTNRAKPPGIHGAEILWMISEVQIDDVQNLLYSVFVTKSPYIFEFGDVARGKRIYFALRWENTRGEKGPWSEIAWAVIP